MYTSVKILWCRKINLAIYKWLVCCSSDWKLNKNETANSSYSHHKRTKSGQVWVMCNGVFKLQHFMKSYLGMCQMQKQNLGHAFICSNASYPLSAHISEGVLETLTGSKCINNFPWRSNGACVRMWLKHHGLRPNTPDVFHFALLIHCILMHWELGNHGNVVNRISAKAFLI